MKAYPFLTAAASLAAFVSPANASAAELLFELSGPTSASWFLNENQTPSVFTNNRTVIRGVSGTINQANQVFDLHFWIQNEDVNGGGFILLNGNRIAEYSGIQLFSGPTSAPRFAAGTFSLTSVDGRGFTLNVSEVPAVPEPGTWLMMIIGLGFTGGAIRFAKRQQSVTVSYA
ncbi:PEPxxWA-CTERM sorting domain-containing protein [Porphyrobacter sp. CACIAM 03H1]|uniref:PEPxxWA-CTERM sorting domain-containing protein n=1 Tax=Porphyrobacter sp. CACIAM 03H1 TaxID=2003315 RepID=UPI000B5A53A3|nr:PEPxxWA-CTERM sorting domain-containing protein [Porphyrobacter sp. CACIAM 03H1]ASJ91147.1 hypothetical protein CBR61_09610 [Porphyrobacter sp. CACIAM 03H1]